LAGLSSILGGINFVVTTLNLRAPGMTMWKLPMFCWTVFITQCIILFSTPVLAGALTMLLTDRLFGTSFFLPAAGGDPVLWQHLFWFYSHPAVYIMVLPGMGAISQVLPVFASKRLFGYKGLVFSTAGIGFIGFLVWGHHMFASGIDPRLRFFFSLASMVIAVPTGVKIWSWIATVWGGSIRFRTPMLYGLGFIALFVCISSWRISITCSSAAPSWRSSPPSTTGSRRSRAASTTSARGRSTSGSPSSG
jgi:cytochrome c oxidase subunit 1